MKPVLHLGEHTMTDLDHLRVVLVAARNPLNIGAAARAMSNFGVRRLRVVNPYEVAFREARPACWRRRNNTRAWPRPSRTASWWWGPRRQRTGSCNIGCTGWTRARERSNGNCKPGRWRCCLVPKDMAYRMTNSATAIG